MNTPNLQILQQRLDAGEAEAVLAECRRLLKDQPEQPALLLLAANACIRMKAWEPACGYLQPLLDRQPMNQALRQNLSQCWNNHARQCLRDGQDKAAELAFRKAVQIWPQNVDAGYNYGLLAVRQQQPAIARQLFATCVQLKPDYADAWLELARLDAAEGRLQPLRQCLETLKKLPLNPEQNRQLGHWLLQAGQGAEGRERLRAAFEQLGGNFAQACQAAFAHDRIYRDAQHLRQEAASLEEGLEWLERQQAGADSLAALAWSHFFRAYQGVNHLPAYRRYARRLQQALQGLPQPKLEAVPQRERPRVVMASSFFRDCTMGHYFASWVDGLVQRGFEVRLLQLGPQQDAFTGQLLGRASDGACCEDVEALQQQIVALRPDVLLYPELGMDARLFPLAARRLAPVQLVAWGHPETTGLELDGFISCAEMEPDDAQAHYSEPLLLLPGLGTAYTLAEAVSGLTRADFHLPEDIPLVLLPHALFKIHPDCDALWAQVAEQVPDVQFVLFEDPEPLATPLFLERLHRQIPAERIRVFRNLPRGHYLALNGLCDLMLDSLHFSGGNTALDAISTGLPIVTLPGARMRGRQTAFMLRRLGLEAWIADDPDDYVAKAVQLLQQPEQRQAVRETLLRNQPRLFQDETPLDALAVALKQRLS